MDQLIADLLREIWNKISWCSRRRGRLPLELCKLSYFSLVLAILLIVHCLFNCPCLHSHCWKLNFTKSKELYGKSEVQQWHIVWYMRLDNLFVRYDNNLFNWCNFCDIALYYLYKAYFSLPWECLIFHQYCSFVLNTILLATKEFLLELTL
jgi:hypothetical protein